MMKHGASGLVGLLLTILSSFVSLGWADSWHYPKPNEDGTVGPTENWGGSCDIGRRQSPIDLAYRASVKGIYPEFSLVNYDEKLSSATLVNNGHTIQVNVEDATRAIYGGGLRNKFILEQFHFHWSSEHTIDDHRYALEVHLVHRNSKYDSIAEAFNQKDGFAVLAVLFHVDEHPNEAIEKILHTTAAVKEHIDKPVDLPKDFDLEDLLPKDRTTYFRYEGSLTIPLCAESVIWTVFTETLPISLDQLQDFKTIHDHEHEELVLNYRPVQPLNSRVLVLVTESEGEAEGASSRLGTSGPLLAVSWLLSIVIYYFRA